MIFAGLKSRATSSANCTMRLASIAGPKREVVTPLTMLTDYITRTTSLSVACDVARLAPLKVQEDGGQEAQRCLPLLGRNQSRGHHEARSH